jgi:hypothetical protein
MTSDSPVAIIYDASGNAASIFPSGFIRVTDEPRQVFYDPFDGSILDTTNRWLSPTSSGGGVAAAISVGNMTLGSGTTASGYSYLQSVPNFVPSVPAWIGYSFAISIEFPVLNNANRFWGSGTSPGTPTTAVPITDGAGFELDTAGKLYAVVYTSGTRSQIADLSSSGTNVQPVDANFHRYIMYYRTDKIYWYIDAISTPVATSNFQAPTVQTLPIKLAATASASAPAASRGISCTGLTVWDTGKNNTQLSDGTFPWRKATVKPASSSAVAGDTALVVALRDAVVVANTTDATTLGTINATDIVVGAPAGNGALLSGTSTVGSYLALACPGGDSAWDIQLTGSFTNGAVYFEESLDSTTGIDGNWIAVNGRQVGVVNTVLSNSATTAGYYCGNTSGAKYWRARMVGALTSPSVATVIRISAGIGSIFLNASVPSGTNTIGNIKVTDGTNTAAIKASSVSAAVTDPALVVAISPNYTDLSATGTLGALNTTVVLNAAGASGIGFAAPGGGVTLIGTLVAEASFDGGSSWAQTFFGNTITGQKASSYNSTSGTGISFSIMPCSGASVYRVRVSAYTSGTAAGTLRSSTLLDTSMFYGAPPGGAAPAGIQMGGRDASFAFQYAEIRPSVPTASVQGLVVRPFMGTDGTNITPTMDAGARKGFQAITDGTNTAAVKAASIAAVATDPSLVVALHPNSPLPAGSNTLGAVSQGNPAAVTSGWPVKITDGTNIMPTMDVAARRAFVQLTDGTNTMPTGDVAARAVFHKNTDGTNTAAVKAASTAAVATDPAMVVAISPTTSVITVQQTATAGTTQPAASITSVTVLGSNANRKGACIFNDSTSAAYICFGATASATVFTVKLAASAYYEVPFGYTGLITGVWVTANGNARVTEIT